MAAGVVGNGREVDLHIEVGLDTPVVAALEEAEQRGFGDRSTGPQVVGRVGADEEERVTRRTRPLLPRDEQRPPVALAALPRVDREQAHVRSVVAFGERDDTGRRVPEHHCRQVGREQRSPEILLRRCVGHRAPAEGGDRVEMGGVESIGADHEGGIPIAPGPGMLESRWSCARARSRFCSGRVVR